MNFILKIISIVFIALIFLSGCTSRSSQNSGQNFDKLEASKTRVSLGLTYLKNGNYSQAKYNLDKGLEFAPRSADANFAMAYYYQSVSELEQAENAYQFAMDLDPKNANIANSYGAFLCQNGDYEKAKTYFLKAVNTSSYVSSAETYENLALCSQNQGRSEDSIQYLRSAVNHQPGRASSLYLLAQSLLDTQQWQEARGILRRYEKVSQISPQSLLMAMKIERGTGNDTAAKGYLDMLVRIFPNDPITKSILTDMQSRPEIVSKTENPPMLKIAAKISPELVASQVTEMATDNTVAVTETETNDSLAIVKDTDIKTDEIVQSNVAATEELSEQVTQATELPTDNTVTETNDSLVIVKDADIKKDEIVKAKVAEKLSQKTEVEPEILDTPDFHVVTKGENLYRISLLYNIKMQRLIEWNDLADASAIYDGKKLSLVAPSVVE
ncbi:type IV pilus biogenesis/stability protein PilW [Paraglaciecola arctica]|uniref:Type IV pilus assembly protein PilF n=1 Tax=Paraglaciecola arctica BSs20135 TaxID=493475 RepID=K6YW14_9ALTE|nr:type IV pilus biogenesis/stability protein PilW [Paraglaciecola arctica]GAC20908.1 type IV pilus assembly protein PilF [Paraglaciecola arctica BSs20135]